jgi:hypothetical protein
MRRFGGLAVPDEHENQDACGDYQRAAKPE